MNVLKFVNENLLKENGILESQRLTKKWFMKHEFNNELKYFIDNDILDSRKLYIHIFNESESCECGKPRRFKGYGLGFSRNCKKCANTKHNPMKKEGKINVQLSDVIAFVKDTNDNYSTTKIKKLSPETLGLINERTSYLHESVKISERLYHIENGLYELPKCKICGNLNTNFLFSKKGYSDYCSKQCSNDDNRHNRSSSLKKYHYDKIKEKYTSNDEYKISLFGIDQYLNDFENCEIKFKHEKCGHEYSYNYRYQGHLKCPKCFTVRSKVQYEIYEWLNGCLDEYKKLKFNDRQLIKPLELDILGDNFAIEYDSIMFHSTGKSEMNFLNNESENPNYHLTKTVLCENHNIQLFRIFSNEWFQKEKIWKSVLLSKIGITDRIYARKCTIKEIPNKTAKSFLEENHLQGGINSSVNLGLYYNDDLISVMTFGKARRSKWKGEKHFELLRFCTLINHTVIGGASKLLRYFEQKYTPNLIVSYANRRWSRGNLYEKLDFEFIENTKPNYFYFEGKENSRLLSREQFQKHKLKDKLNVFNEALTETQNMYNNGYRKIYDCGHKVYMKKYKY